MQHVIDVDGIDIWCEEFGRRGDPEVLLIMGTGESGLSWPDPLCVSLAEEGRHVIRYDNRDTGRSSRIDFTGDPYTLTDMAADAMGVLDALGVTAAHIVGVSMGGMIAQEIAIESPERVLTLTLLITTPTVNDPVNPTTFVNGLPDMDVARLMPVFMELAEHPPTTDAERVESALALARATKGSRGFLNEEAFRESTVRTLAHSGSPGNTQNHSQAISRSRDRTELLKSVVVPTLVVHGTEDPIFPYAHAVATSQAVPGARLMTMEGMGHELPAPPELTSIIRSQLNGG